MTTNYLQRLSFAKFLFEEGVKKSILPNPNDSITILHLHDSIDIFMQLLCEIYNCKPQKTNSSLLELVNSINPVLIDLKKEKINASLINRLNTARNKLKHETIFLNRTDIQGFVVSVRSFFEESIPLHFNELEFDSISLVNFVKDIEIKNCLLDAEQEIIKNDYENALISINKALGYILHNFTSIIDLDDYRDSIKPSKWFESISRHYRSQGNKLVIDGFNDFEKGLNESFDYLNDLIVLTNLGIDIQEYAKFKKYRLRGGMSDDEYIVFGEYDNDINEQEIKFCFNFVLQMALK